MGRPYGTIARQLVAPLAKVANVASPSPPTAQPQSPTHAEGIGTGRRTGPKKRRRAEARCWYRHAAARHSGHLCSAIIWSLFVSFLFRCPSKELTWAGRSPFHCALTAEIICSFSPSAVGSLAICKLTYCRFLNLNAWLSYIYMHLHIGLSTSLRCAALRLQGTRRKQPVSATQSCNPVPFAKISRPCAGVRIHAHGTHLDNRLAGCRRGRTGASHHE